MPDVKDEVDLQARVNKLLLQVTNGDLKEAEAAANGLIQLGAELPGEKTALECLARESIGYAISKKKPSIIMQYAINFLADKDLIGENSPNDSVCGALSLVEFTDPEIGELARKFDINGFDVKLGTLKFKVLQAIVSDVSQSLDNYSASGQSTQSWMQENIGRYRILGHVLDDVEEIGGLNDSEKIAKGIQKERAYPKILRDSYETAANLALRASNAISRNRKNDDRQRELLRDDVIEGAGTLHGIAIEYSEKTGNENFVSKTMKRSLDLFKLRIRVMERRLPEIVKTQMTLLRAAARAAKTGDKAAFEQAKKPYADFMKTHLGMLDHGEEYHYDYTMGWLLGLYERNKK